ncbi:MAG: hypothetical protein ACQKBU_09540, partial [Verrucomicrobiales bacterium]
TPASESRSPSRCFFDFSRHALDPLTHPDWQHFPGLALEGIIVALSFPDPPSASGSQATQPGAKDGSYGRLLPGFYLEQQPGGSRLHGPACPSEGLSLPEGLTLDPEGFLIREN